MEEGCFVLTIGRCNIEARGTHCKIQVSIRRKCENGSFCIPSIFACILTSYRHDGAKALQQEISLGCPHPSIWVTFPTASLLGSSHVCLSWLIQVCFHHLEA
jgi:hypothetical protein